jgi:hypothetical protein
VDLFLVLFLGQLRAMFDRDINRVEVYSLLAAAALAAILPRVFAFAGYWGRRIARRRTLAVTTVFLLALVTRAAVFPILGTPAPQVHDEFSHLLQADTFLHGRLANPTHPFWRHFETIHIFHQPVYASMHFPMQGFILAFGRLLGDPFVGVWLSNALACAALCWMLQGWLPAEWAFLGGLLGVARIAIFSYWANSYWGGAHPLLGAALVLGAWPRLLRRPTAANSATMALGMAVLAMGRPYEGALLCLPVGISVLWNYGRRLRVMFPVALILAVTAAGMMYYCWRLTGSPLKIPYQVNRELYGWPQTLAWMYTPEPPLHRHAEMRRYYYWEMTMNQQYQSRDRLTIETMVKWITVWSFYIGAAFTPGLLALPWALRARRLRRLLVPGGILTFSLFFSQTVQPHYAAPVAPIILAYLMQGFRHLRFCRLRYRRIDWPLGRAVLAAAPLALLVTVGLRWAHQARTVTLAARPNVFSWCCLPMEETGQRRIRIKQAMEQIPGRHLVIVRYPKGDHKVSELVYNAADIDAARVVWARDMGDETNQAIMRHYLRRGRRVWMLRPELVPWQLREVRRLKPAPR